MIGISWLMLLLRAAGAGLIGVGVKEIADDVIVPLFRKSNNSTGPGAPVIYALVGAAILWLTMGQRYASARRSFRRPGGSSW